MKNDLSEIRVFLFETAWGWCGAKIGPGGIIAFELPLADFDKALRIARERFFPDANAADALCTPKFSLRRTADAVGRKLGNEWGGKLAAQVREYFEGRRRGAFELQLDWTGASPFRKKVWKELLGVPFGRTATYGDLAGKIGRPGAARAVGSAMGANPVPLIVPCHRVLASGDRMGGFSARGGVATKKRLLEFEKTAIESS